MTREECETAAEYMEREPEYLTAYISRTGLSCNNKFWPDGEDADKPIDAWRKS